MAILIFIYISCIIYNNIIVNADNDEYFMFLEEDNPFVMFYYVMLPIASILFTIYWIKEDFK